MSSNSRSTWRDLVLAGLAGLAALVVAGWGLSVALGDLSIPWAEGDLLSLLSYAKNMSEGNWFLTNPDLGYPSFQDHGHFPVTDLVSIAQIALLVLVLPPITAVNAFTLGTFFTVAATFYLSLRFEGIGRWIAFVAAFCFSLLPWHFVRTGGHNFLASYMSVSIALFLISLVARRRLEQPHHRALLPVAMVGAIVVGANGIYYSLMTTMLLAVVLLLGSLATWRAVPGWRSLVVSALVPLTSAAAVAVNLISISTPSTGDNVARNAAESYTHGGNLATLFFPSPATVTGNRLSGFLDLAFPNQGSFEGDAFLSSAGVLAVIIALATMLLRWTTEKSLDPRGALGRASFWPGLMLFAIGFFAMGGLGALFSFWVSTDIRAWGRMSVFVVGLAFLITGHVLTAWWHGERGLTKWMAWTATALLAVLAVVDLSRGGFRPNIEPFRARAAELDAFVGAIESRTEPDCPVLELPLVPFPEYGPINSMGDYSHLWSYLYSDDLKWSYGAFKGTPGGTWGVDIKDDPDALLGAAQVAGFCGIQLDTAAFANLAEGADEVGALGQPDVVSQSGRWWYFDLTGPLPGEYVYWPSTGFSGAEATPENPTFWWMVMKSAKLRVVGVPGESVMVSISLTSPPCGPSRIAIGGAEVKVDGQTVHEAPVVLDESGSADINLVGSEPCEVEGDDRRLFVGVHGPLALRPEPSAA